MLVPILHEGKLSYSLYEFNAMTMILKRIGLEVNISVESKINNGE